jgi:hypothetical protein
MLIWNPATDRLILASGVRTAHRTLLTEGDCETGRELARQQLANAARKAGVDLEEGKR